MTRVIVAVLVAILGCGFGCASPVALAPLPMPVPVRTASTLASTLAGTPMDLSADKCIHILVLVCLRDEFCSRRKDSAAECFDAGFSMCRHVSGVSNDSYNECAQALNDRTCVEQVPDACVGIGSRGSAEDSVAPRKGTEL